MKLSLQLLILNLVSGGIMAANAQQIFSQSALNSILGSGGVFEDFEGRGLLPASGQFYSNAGYLSSTTTFAGYGPGLVQPGAAYTAPELWLNEDGYYGLNTRTLADSSQWRGDGIAIIYSVPVTAMGFDMQGYEGFSMAGTVSVYDTADALLASIDVNGGFFGWENAAGIGRVFIANSNDGYIMVDNHGYGVTVPEPASLALLALGIAGIIWSRRLVLPA